MTTTHLNLNELDLRSMSTDELERMPPSPRYPDARILAELRRRDALTEGRIVPRTNDVDERDARTPLGHPWT